MHSITWTQDPDIHVLDGQLQATSMKREYDSMAGLKDGDVAGDRRRERN